MRRHISTKNSPIKSSKLLAEPPALKKRPLVNYPDPLGNLQKNLMEEIKRRTRALRL